MQLDQLKRAHAHKKEKRVGRGGKRGKTAGRGTKGQKARAGHRMRPELRDIIKKFPKSRGYRFKAFRPKPTPVNLTQLERSFDAGVTIDPKSLVERKLAKMEGGKLPSIKILGTGVLTKKFAVSGCSASASAKKAIEAAGGTIA